MTEPDHESPGGGPEAPDDAWPQLERRDWSTRPADVDVSAGDQPEHDAGTPAPDPGPDEPDV